MRRSRSSSRAHDGKGGSTPAEFKVTVEEVTGIEDQFFTNHTIIKPNPSSGLFNIEIKTTNPDRIYMIVRDIGGKTVLNQLLEKHSSEFHFELDLSKNPNGVYFLSIIGQNGGNFIQRLIKE